MEPAIHLMGETFYSKRNFPVLHVVDRHHAVGLHGRVFSRSARNYVDAAGSYRQLRAGRREGGAQRGHCIHHSDGLSDNGGVSVFGRRAATIFRRTTSATARQANAAGPWLGRDR